MNINLVSMGKNRYEIKFKPKPLNQTIPAQSPRSKWDIFDGGYRQLWNQQVMDITREQYESHIRREKIENKNFLSGGLGPASKQWDALYMASSKRLLYAFNGLYSPFHFNPSLSRQV